MASKPMVVSAVVKDTGWPMDGHKINFAKWEHDPDNWHLYSWGDDEEAAVMLTIWQSLQEAGAGLHDTFEEYKKAWDAKEPVTDMVFVLTGDELEIVETIQEAEPEVSIEPRKITDKGGIMLLPLWKNIRNAAENHPDWELTTCPECGQECWKFPEAHRLQLTQGVNLMCTECGIKAGIVKSYTPKNMPHPDGNRAKRRAAMRRARKRS